MLELLAGSWIVHTRIECWTGMVNVTKALERNGQLFTKQVLINAYTKDLYLRKVRSIAIQARNRIQKDTVNSMFGPLCPDPLKDALIADLTHLKALFEQRLNDFLTHYDRQKVIDELHRELQKQNILISLDGEVPDAAVLRQRFHFHFSLTPLRLKEVIGFDPNAQREETEYLVAAILAKLRSQFRPFYRNIVQRAHATGFQTLSMRDWDTLRRYANRAAVFLAGLSVPTLAKIQQAIQQQNVLLALLEMRKLAEEDDYDELFQEIVGGL